MVRRLVGVVVWVWWLLGGAVGEKRPHLVVYVADDLGWADVGYNGGNFPTPTLDGLAKSEVKLERFYTSPQCSPTRSSLTTGRYAFKLGMQHFTTVQPGSTAGLPSDVKTVAEALKEVGYSTHMIGKWHLGAASYQQIPTERGFDSFMGYLNGEMQYYNRTLAAGGLYASDFGVPGYMNGSNGASFDAWTNATFYEDAFGRYSADDFDAEFARIITTRDVHKPLFVYFAQQLVHVPLEAPPVQGVASDDRYDECASIDGGSDRQTLCSMVSRLDQSVKATLETLAPIWNHTVFWFVSDNGGMTDVASLSHGSASSNWPLRGSKTTLFEGGVRVPSIVAGWGLFSKQRNISALMHATDLAVTIRALGGADAYESEDLPVDGLDAWPVISGSVLDNETALRDEIPLNVDKNPLRGHGFPPHATNINGTLNYSALIRWPYKLVVGCANDPALPHADGWWTVSDYRHVPPPLRDIDRLVDLRLFDLRADPSEKNDLAADFPDLAHILYARLSDYWGSADAGFRPPQWNKPLQVANPSRFGWIWHPFINLSSSYYYGDFLYDDDHLPPPPPLEEEPDQFLSSLF